MMKLLAIILATTGLAAGAGSHYDSNALHACLSYRQDTRVFSPLRNGDAGMKIDPRIARHVLYVAFDSGGPDPGLAAMTFFAFGRSTKEARRERDAVRKAFSRSLIKELPYAGGGAKLNVAWFSVGRMTPTVSDAISGCLAKSLRR